MFGPIFGPMSGLSRELHPLDSRHPDNRKIDRALKARREGFRTAEKGHATRHFFLPPKADTARSRLADLQAKPHLTHSQEREVTSLKAQLYALDRDQVEKDTLKSVPLPLRLIFGTPIRAYAMLRGQWSVRGRKQRDRWTIWHVLAIGAVLMPMIYTEGGLVPAIEALLDGLRIGSTSLITKP